MLFSCWIGGCRYVRAWRFGWNGRYYVRGFIPMSSGSDRSVLLACPRAKIIRSAMAYDRHLIRDIIGLFSNVRRERQTVCAYPLHPHLLQDFPGLRLWGLRRI